MNGAVAPPRPDLLADEREERREQLQLHHERRPERSVRRRRRLLVAPAVAAPLHELHVVVAEPPEERLRMLERARVVVAVERVRRGLDRLREPPQHRDVERLRGVSDRPVVAEHEARDVQHLGRQAAPHLHLVLVEGGVDARAPVCRPVADGVRAVLLEHRHRRQHIALGLRHLLAVGIEHPARDRGVLPGQAVVLEVRPHDRREQPGPDDLVRLRPKVHREHALEEIGILAPTAGDLRRERGRGPCVHHVGVAREAPGLAALVGLESGWNVGRRVDGQRGVLGKYRPGVVDRPVVANGVPDRERHTEEALAADRPVLVEAVDPVLVADAHVLGDPAQLAAAGLELLAVLECADEPLPAGDDLERALALLEELHRVLDRLRLRRQRARLREQPRNLLLRGLGTLAGQVVVRGLGCGGVLGLEPGLAPADRAQPAVGVDHRPDRQPELAPPHHVGHVAERADHGDPGALLGIGQLVRQYRHASAEQRGDDLAAGEQRPVPLVARVGDERHARRDQLRPRRLDLDRAVAVGAPEQHAVRGAGDRAVLELGLRDRRPEVDVPQRRRLDRVGEVLSEQVEEGALRRPLGTLADRRVGHRPVDREAELAPQGLERLLVLGRQPEAELHEVLARNRDGVVRRLRRRVEAGVIRERGVATDAEVVLHAPLGRQPVVVPAHRVEDVLPAHPLVARDEVRVRVGEDMPDVQRATDRWRRRIDRVDRVAARRAVERVDSFALPALGPLRLDPPDGRLFGHAGWHAGKRIAACGFSSARRGYTRAPTAAVMTR